jgi:hypothetical protein
MMPTLTTPADRARWQRQAAAVLHELIVQATAEKLPLITWQISIAGTLMGRCVDTDMVVRRETFTRWTGFIGMDAKSEWEANGITHLYGVTDGFRGCPVTITADLLRSAGGEQ